MKLTASLNDEQCCVSLTDRVETAVAIAARSGLTWIIRSGPIGRATGGRLVQVADVWRCGGDARVSRQSGALRSERIQETGNADDVERPSQIVRERGEAELSSNLRKPSHEKCALVHPLLDRAEWMLD